MPMLNAWSELGEDAFYQGRAGAADEKGEGVAFRSSIADELADFPDFPSVTSLFKPSIELSQRVYGFEAHEQQSQKH